MKSVSASIIILSASMLIAVGAFIQHDQSQLFVQAVGCLLGLIGLVGWFVAFKDPTES